MNNDGRLKFLGFTYLFIILSCIYYFYIRTIIIIMSIFYYKYVYFYDNLFRYLTPCF